MPSQQYSRAMKIKDLAPKFFNRTRWNPALTAIILLTLSLTACKSSSATSGSDAIDSLLSQDNYVKIKAGNFLMGSPEPTEPEMYTNKIIGRERPQHRVLITQAFEMGRYEVTQRQWEAVMGNNPSSFKGPDLPVTNVSWYDTQEFLKRLGPLDDQYDYRLPTEAEWEYACRAGSTGHFSGEEMKIEKTDKSSKDKGGKDKKGKTAEPRKTLEERLAEEHLDMILDIKKAHKSKYESEDFQKNLPQIGWYKNNSQNRPHAVGKLKPNAWGLYDMHGNVWEWCQDWFEFGYYKESPAENPQGPTTGTAKINRGGSWQIPAFLCRSAVRGYDTPNERNHVIGFRLARVKKEPK